MGDRLTFHTEVPVIIISDKMFSRLWNSLMGKKELRILQWNCNGIRPKVFNDLQGPG